MTIEDRKPRTGCRASTSAAYLWPAMQKNEKTLTVVSNALVDKIVISPSKKVLGVEYSFDEYGTRKTSTARLAEAHSSEKKNSASVILSAGAFGSPAILERSGIGNVNLLKNMGEFMTEG
eukprot:GHVN01023903.1.p2 GENE.GHVN01023903.1~~GHVN01023903.1.p2  ORF type:complete len:140 (-),score=24.19 GHVN01023903.1:751-1110(-)